jgi:hypothetical protein
LDLPESSPISEASPAVRAKLPSTSLVSALLLAVSGCGAFRETLPLRSSAEQMILSTAADRSVESMPTDWLDGRTVFVDAANLDCYDKPYVLQRIRHTILTNGGRLAADADSADALLEVASGGLSVDRGSFMLGLPEIPLPLPFATEPVKTPELPIFKLTSYVGRSRMLFSVMDRRTRKQIRELPVCYGRSTVRFWTVPLIGPFESSDIPEGTE